MRLEICLKIFCTFLPIANIQDAGTSWDAIQPDDSIHNISTTRPSVATVKDSWEDVLCSD